MDGSIATSASAIDGGRQRAVNGLETWTGRGLWLDA